MGLTGGDSRPIGVAGAVPLQKVNEGMMRVPLVKTRGNSNVETS